MDRMPKWADALLVPLISVLIAFVISGLVIIAIGEDPVEAVKLMVTKEPLESSCGQITIHAIAALPRLTHSLFCNADNLTITSNGLPTRFVKFQR